MTSAATVLVVDDDEDIRITLADVIEHLGYQAQTAEHGAEALAILQREPVRPSLILLDMMMPVMDGAAFLAELQKSPELASIPVVVISAHGKVDDLLQQFEPIKYLRKPIALSDLADVIERSRT